MFKRNHAIGLCVTFFLFCLVSFFLLLFLKYPADEQSAQQNTTPTLLTLNTVTATIDGVSQDITLPYTFTDLSPRTEVSITASFSLPALYSFYIESEYTPLELFINDTLIYTYGEDGSYSAAMKDPATAGEIVMLGEETDLSTIHLQIDYYSPITRDYFTIDPIYFGTQNALYEMLFQEMGFSFLFSLALILVSVFLAIVTLFITTFEPRALRILLLGLAGCLAGLWLLCDCTLTSLFIATPTQLYLISLYSMALFPVPLIWFALAVVEFRNRNFLFTVALIELLFCILSIHFLAFDIVQSMIYVCQAFDLLVPLCVTLLAVYVLFEYIMYHTISLRRFALPAIMFALFSILEVSNNKFYFANLPFSFFQMGIMVFMFAMGILAGLFMRDMLALQTEAQQAAFDMQMIEYQSGMLKKHSNLIMDTSDNLRKQRHDLRHQLTAIKELANKNDFTGLHQYLDSVMTHIPTEQIFYCNNSTVNAILSHYASICNKEGVPFTVDVFIPEHPLSIHDTDYCVIFGNLLENAVEACRYLPSAERYIRIQSYMRYNTLLITMENSFDGNYKRSGGVFRSRKRDSNGIGLSSVQSLAEKHGGDASFKPAGTVFTSSVYMVL